MKGEISASPIKSKLNSIIPLDCYRLCQVLNFIMSPNILPPFRCSWVSVKDSKMTMISAVICLQFAKPRNDLRKWWFDLSVNLKYGQGIQVGLLQLAELVCEIIYLAFGCSVGCRDRGGDGKMVKLCERVDLEVSFVNITIYTYIYFLFYVIPSSSPPNERIEYNGNASQIYG